MKTLASLALVAALAVAAGCSNDTKANPGGAVTTDAGLDGGGTTPDGSTLDGPVAMADGGALTDGAAGMPDGALTSIGLVDFVTGLVNNSTNATALPATIDDKMIIDTNDPAAFDKLLGL